MSNDQNDLEERIAAYIDGELPPAEAARLEVYLANTDAKLAEQVINMIGDRHRLRALHKETAPDDLAARIMEQVERTSLLHNVDQLAPPRRSWWQSRGALAAGILLVLGGFTYFMLQPLRPANSAWQAAIDTNPSPRQPAIAAGPDAPPPTPSPAPSASPAPMATLAQAAPKRDRAEDTIAKDQFAAAAPAAPTVATAPAAANAPLSIAAAEVGEPFARRTFRGSQEAPITLAFVARDAADVQRFQATLDALKSADQAVTFPRDGTMDDRAQLKMQNNVQTDQAGAVATGAAASPQPSQSTNRSLDQYSQYNQSNAGAHAQRQSVPEMQTNAAESNTTHMAGLGTKSQLADSSPAPVTYRLALRPSEIADLTRQFQTDTSSTHNDFKAVPATSAPAATPEDKLLESPRPPVTTAPAAAVEKAAATDRIDCIITMTLAPATTSQPTQTAP